MACHLLRLLTAAFGQFCLKSRKSNVIANLPKYERHLRLTLITAADRFRTRSVEFEADDEAPRVRI